MADKQRLQPRSLRQSRASNNGNEMSGHTADKKAAQLPWQPLLIHPCPRGSTTHSEMYITPCAHVVVSQHTEDLLH